MLSAKKLGLAGGILWGASMFIMTFLSLWFDYGTAWQELFVGIYPGYSISFVGAFIGLVYGFIDGFIGLFILGWLYNKIPD